MQTKPSLNAKPNSNNRCTYSNSNRDRDRNSNSNNYGNCNSNNSNYNSNNDNINNDSNSNNNINRKGCSTTAFKLTKPRRLHHPDSPTSRTACLNIAFVPCNLLNTPDRHDVNAVRPAIPHPVLLECVRIAVEPFRALACKLGQQ